MHAPGSDAFYLQYWVAPRWQAVFMSSVALDPHTVDFNPVRSVGGLHNLLLL